MTSIDSENVRADWDPLMKPKIMMSVHTVRSMAFWFFLGTGTCTGSGTRGSTFSPSRPSPGTTPSSNLTLFLDGELGVNAAPGPAGVKSEGALRLRFAGDGSLAGCGRDSGREGANVGEVGGDASRGCAGAVAAGAGAAEVAAAGAEVDAGWGTSGASFTGSGCASATAGGSALSPFVPFARAAAAALARARFLADLDSGAAGPLDAGASGSGSGLLSARLRVERTLQCPTLRRRRARARRARQTCCVGRRRSWRGWPR
jgi:hypothetical protein